MISLLPFSCRPLHTLSSWIPVYISEVIRKSSTIYSACNVVGADVNKIMQLYHHPYSLDSQKVRLALEEKSIDYTSYHVNPITGKNMDSSFFRMNPSGKLPVFKNGAHIIFSTIEIIQYVSSFSHRLLSLFLWKTGCVSNYFEI